MSGEYTLEEAKARIRELEKEVSDLKEKLSKYEALGRKKHDEKWQSCYELFVNLYEDGNPIQAIVEKSGFSRRTVYRYKEYYDELKKIKK